MPQARFCNIKLDAIFQGEHFATSAATRSPAWAAASSLTVFSNQGWTVRDNGVIDRTASGNVPVNGNATYKVTFRVEQAGGWEHTGRVLLRVRDINFVDVDYVSEWITINSLDPIFEAEVTAPLNDAVRLTAFLDRKSPFVSACKDRLDELNVIAETV